mmetsp:Transcript_28407/g.60870  ORF Transcript_28407/g.60870 Transcript_28407/m.60870 type:complete len:203 (+) Transcript_28407:136-744(+)
MLLQYKNANRSKATIGARVDSFCPQRVVVVVVVLCRVASDPIGSNGKTRTHADADAVSLSYRLFFLFFLLLPGPRPRNRSPTDRILFEARLLDRFHIFEPRVRRLFCSSSSASRSVAVSESSSLVTSSSVWTRVSSPWVRLRRLAVVSRSALVVSSFFCVLRRAFCSSSYLSSSTRFDSAACFSSEESSSFSSISSTSLVLV